MTEVMAAFLAAVSTHASATTTASAIANQLVEVVGARSACVYLTEGDEHSLSLMGCRNAPEARSQLAVFDGDSRVPAAKAARNQALVVSTEGRGDETSLALPLLSGGRLLGAVSFELPRRIEGRELAVLDSLGVVLGAIVDRARREDEARVRSEWTSLVAHELRQPLSTMTLQVGFILAAASDERAGGIARRLAGSVARLNRLVGDLSDAALVDLRRIRLNLAPTNLVELADRVACGGGPDHPRPVEVEVTGEIPEMPLDGDRIEQVLTNLLANAEKYGREGTPIRLAMEAGARDVVISLTSDGDDIPEEELPRIFDRFHRAHDGRTEGLGIGLYVCRGLVEAHRGTISVRSGGGTTTFSVALPLPRRGPTLALCSPTPPKQPQNPSPASTRR